MLTPPRMSGLGKHETATVAPTHYEHPAPKLRDPELGGQQDLPLRVVAEICQLSQQPFELRAMGPVGQPLHVLQDERLWPSIAHDSHVLVEQRGVRVGTVTL